MSTATGLSKLGQALSVIFVVSFLALVAELFYVLWRRRFFQRQSTALDGDRDAAAPPRISFPNSKELLYLLCWKQNHSRVEPDGSGGSDPETGCNGPSSSMEDTNDDDVIDILKLQAMRGPSRVLFTINEEEREDVESEAEQSVSVSSSAVAEKSYEKTRRVSLEECFNVDGDLTEEEEMTTVTVVVGSCDCEIETPPYSTPCGSPLYYTPSASPLRGFEVGLENVRLDGIVCWS